MVYQHCTAAFQFSKLMSSFLKLYKPKYIYSIVSSDTISRVTRKFRPIHQVTSWHICHLTTLNSWQKSYQAWILISPLCSPPAQHFPNWDLIMHSDQQLTQLKVRIMNWDKVICPLFTFWVTTTAANLSTLQHQHFFTLLYWHQLIDILHRCKLFWILFNFHLSYQIFFS